MKILLVIIIFLIVIILVFRKRKSRKPVEEPQIVHDYRVSDRSHHVRIIEMTCSFEKAYTLSKEAIGLLTFCNIKNENPEGGYIRAGLDWDIDSHDDILEIQLEKLDSGNIQVRISCEVMVDDSGKINEMNKYAVDVIQMHMLANDDTVHLAEDRSGDEYDKGHAFDID